MLRDIHKNGGLKSKMSNVIKIRVETSQIVETCKQAVEKLAIYKAKKYEELLLAMVRPVEYSFFGLIKTQSAVDREKAIEIIKNCEFYDYYERYAGKATQIYYEYRSQYEGLKELMLKLIPYAPDSTEGSMLLPLDAWNEICNISLMKV